MKNAEMIVFWSSDPESTSGVYGAQEGTIRREWIKQLNIPVVHIDPYLNSTASFMGGRWIAPRPGDGYGDGASNCLYMAEKRYLR